MSETQVYTVDRGQLQELRTRLADLLGDPSEQPSIALTPEEIDAILERLERETGSDN